MRKYLFCLLLGALLPMIISCNSTNSSAGSTSDSLACAAAVTTEVIDTIPREAGVEVGEALMVPSKNIMENMVRSKDHTTWVTAVQAAGMAATLESPGPFTVFIPDNKAFNKLPAGMVDSLLQPGKQKELKALLAAQVLPGAYRPEDLKDGMELSATGGKKLRIKHRNGTWWVNDARITVTDVICSNGIIYITDAVGIN